jgi:hypothetical protein
MYHIATGPEVTDRGIKKHSGIRLGGPSTSYDERVN